MIKIKKEFMTGQPQKMVLGFCLTHCGLEEYRKEKKVELWLKEIAPSDD